MKPEYFTIAQAIQVGEILGIKWDKFDVDKF